MVNSQIFARMRVISPLKKALMPGFHPLANHNVPKAVSSSFGMMKTIRAIRTAPAGGSGVYAC
jgi:hypothetical protein